MDADLNFHHQIPTKSVQGEGRGIKGLVEEELQGFEGEEGSRELLGCEGREELRFCRGGDMRVLWRRN